MTHRPANGSPADLAHLGLVLPFRVLTCARASCATPWAVPVPVLHAGAGRPLYCPWGHPQPGDDDAPPPPVAPGGGPDPDRLSPRVRQTLDGLLAGESEKQVAHRLGVSPHTVHAYVRTLYRKYGAESRGDLLARFVRRPAF